MAEHADVLVAGSGAAALTAALVCAEAGARTLVCESSTWLGGTSAASGGRVWVPGNQFQPDPDADRRAASRYLAGLFPGHPEMTAAFLDAAPAMARFVEEHSPHRFVPCENYPDYHPDLPGATHGGRCLDARPLALTALDPIVGQVAIPRGHVPMTHAEWEHWRRPGRYDFGLLDRRRAGRIVTSGPALVSALVDGVARAGGRILASHRLLDVRVGRAGGYQTVLGTPDGGQVTVPADSVVLATGGYDQSPALRRQHLPSAITASASAPANVGDALDICARLGARLENLGQGWWMPMVAVPGEGPGGAPGYRALIRERGLPRMIVVDRSGRRFVDEAAPYHEFCKAFMRTDGAGHASSAQAYLVFDEGYRRSYGVPCAGTADPVPGWVARAPTVARLAADLDIDETGLTHQVDRWNAACALGADTEFGKGGNAYDRYYGDPDQAGNPNLGPLDEPPYYGIPVVAGTIGSKGGPVTDPDGRVLGPGGTPLPGIYAAGNAAAFWTADGYPGPGATLGIGMTFGYRAGRAIARAAP